MTTREQKRFLKEAEERRLREETAAAIASHEARINAAIKCHEICPPPFDWVRAAAVLPAPRFEFARPLVNWFELQNDRPAVEARRQLALGVLSHDPKAYVQALDGVSFISQLKPFVRSLDYTSFKTDRVECTLRACSPAIIPQSILEEGAKGQLKERNRPTKESNSLYLDFICAITIRVARETFAVLPVKRLLVNTYAQIAVGDAPILSVRFSRETFQSRQLWGVDPSDFMEGLDFRANFKESRRGEAFSRIEPLSFDGNEHALGTDLAALVKHIDRAHEVLSERIAEINS